MSQPIHARVCLYCSRPIGLDEQAAACDVCLAAHHQECWERNGRCSTFNCGGAPRAMLGSGLAAVSSASVGAMQAAPTACLFCSGRLYAGGVQTKPLRPPGHALASPTPGLMFVGRGKSVPFSDWFGMRFLAKMLGHRSWFLPGASLRASSCGNCRKLYVGGKVVDDQAIQTQMEDESDRPCPHCATPMWTGTVLLEPHRQGAAFRSDSIPDFHNDWFGHNVLDRYFHSHWRLPMKALPARSCPACSYTEAAGQQVYRFG